LKLIYGSRTSDELRFLLGCSTTESHNEFCKEEVSKKRGTLVSRGTDGKRKYGWMPVTCSGREKWRPAVSSRITERKRRGHGQQTGRWARRRI